MELNRRDELVRRPRKIACAKIVSERKVSAKYGKVLPKQGMIGVASKSFDNILNKIHNLNDECRALNLSQTHVCMCVRTFPAQWKAISAGAFHIPHL